MTGWVEGALAAECRAVEEGHHARWDDARQRFLVKSDSGPRTYEITVQAVVPANLACAAWLSFGCTCPAGVRGRTSTRPVPCKHAALVARRLERMGLATWDAAHNGPWHPLGALLDACRLERAHLSVVR